MTVSVIILGALFLVVMSMWVSRYYSIQLHNRMAYRRCPGCGYPKHGSTSLTCPECGSVWGNDAQIEIPGFIQWIMMPLHLLTLYVVLPFLLLAGIVWLAAKL